MSDHVIDAPYSFWLGADAFTVTESVTYEPIPVMVAYDPNPLDGTRLWDNS